MAKRKKEKSILARLMVIGLGLLLVLFTLALLISCLSYNTADTGYNTANSNSLSNLFGHFGAYSSSFILSWFGLALPLFLITPLVWGYEIIRYKTFIHPFGRIFAFILGVFSLSIFINLCFGEIGSFKSGGNIGVFFSRQFLSVFSRQHRGIFLAPILVRIFTHLRLCLQFLDSGRISFCLRAYFF